MTANRLSPFFWCVTALLVITIARILYLPFAPGLFFDEAQYWTWSKAMDFGFYSKPPMVAAWIWLTSSLCGDGEACIRLSSPLLHLGTALLVYGIGSTLYEKRDGIWSAIIYLTLPAVSLSSSLISTDPSLLFFWALALFMFIHALKEDSWKYWIGCGVAAGFGMMSKYSMAFFLPSVVFYLLTHVEHRKLLFSPKLWIAGVVALLIFIPNILWNFDNHFVSFLHTQDNANLSDAWFNPQEFLAFFGAQFGVFGPFLFTVLVALFLTLPKRLKTPHAGLLLCFILPFLITIFCLSFLSRAHANWAAPVYVPASVLVSHWLLTHARFRWILYSSVGLHSALLILFLFFTPVVSTLGITLAGKGANLKELQIRDPFLRLRGWDALGKSVAERLKQYPTARLMTVSRKTHAYLRYYAKPTADTALKWNADEQIHDHYELTTALSENTKQPYLLISEWDDVSYITKYFSTVEKLNPIDVKVYQTYQHHYNLYYLSGYKGKGEAND